MKIRLLEIAQIELDEAVEYYNSESHGLGDEFLLDAIKAIERIRHFPKAWHPFSNNTRRCQLRRFPYGVRVILKQRQKCYYKNNQKKGDKQCG